MRNVTGSFLLLATLAGATACAGSIRVYDEPRHDYHRWNRGEERSYRVYLTDHHRVYLDFKKLDSHDQDDYWTWRHDHPDHR